MSDQVVTHFERLQKYSNRKAIVAFLAVTSFVSSCRSTAPQTDDTSETKMARDSSFVGRMRFAAEFDLSKESGKTYLSFMRDKVKPAMDQIATDGYQIADDAAFDLTYKASDKKVQMKVNKLWGGIEGVKSVAAELRKIKKPLTLKTLPLEIRKIDSKVDAYGMATFIGLASGGGVAIKYSDKNYSFNVHYDVTEQKSGRSFGTGPARGANDASDKQYLDDLESYVVNDGENIPAFYSNLFNALLNSDTSRYAEISDEGKALLTDFLAVFTAEQARNLMDGKVTPHWDAALLEVTLLAAFHSGQEKIKLFYNDRKDGGSIYTNLVYNQEACKKPTGSKRQAKMRDYWQFSAQIDNVKNCKRSGINVTKREFRRLESAISKYVESNNNKLYRKIAGQIKARSGSVNLFESLSYFLISENSPRSFSQSDVANIADAWTEMLVYAQKNASAIDAFIAGDNGEGGAARRESVLDDADVSGGFDAIYDEDERLK